MPGARVRACGCLRGDVHTRPQAKQAIVSNCPPLEESHHRLQSTQSFVMKHLYVVRTNLRSLAA